MAPPGRCRAVGRAGFGAAEAADLLKPLLDLADARRERRRQDLVLEDLAVAALDRVDQVLRRSATQARLLAPHTIRRRPILGQLINEYERAA